MAKLRHIALMVKQPKKLFDFYHHLFGVEQVRLSPTGSIHVIDGLFNLAFLQQMSSGAEVVNTHRADGTEVNQMVGINHFGFLVENLEGTLGRLESSIRRGQSPQNGRPAEMRIIDPWGNNVDISSRGFLGREEKKLPGVRYMVLQTPDPDRTAAFYKSVFELRETKRDGREAVYLTDGDITLCVTGRQTLAKRGIQYFGIQVEDWSATRARFKEIGLDLPPQTEKRGEVQVTDPEGNLLVLSEEGWAS